MSEVRSPGSIGAMVWCALLGALVAVVGTGVHRLNPPMGVTLALVIVAAAGVMVRAWAGPRGVVALGVGLVVVVALMGRSGPGGDVLIAAQPVGYVWYTGVLVVAAVGLLPRRWFSDEPVRRTGEVHGPRPSS